jgi:hypothetical protein
MAHRPVRTLRAAVMSAAAIAAVLTSCSLLGSRDITQCASDDDCKVNDSPTVGNPRVACVEGLCAPRTATSAVDASDAPPDVVTKCTITKDCPVVPASICLNGTCTELVKKDVCTRVATSEQYPNVYREDGALLVGVYGYSPLSNVALVTSVQAALDDINAAVPKNVLRVSALFCEKKSKLDQGLAAKNAIGHLASLKVPLIVGQFEASELRELDAKGLTVWSTLGNDTASAASDDYRFLVDELKTTASGFQAAVDLALVRLSNPAAPKVLMVVADQTEMGPLADAVAAQLVIPNGGTLEVLPTKVPSEYEAPSTDNLEVRKAIIAAQPRVIIGIGGDEIAKLLDKIENPGAGEGIWPTGPTPPPRPMWVVGARLKFAASTLQLARQKLAGNYPLHRRVIGVDFGGNRDHFLARDIGGDNPGSYDNAYDAMFTVAFAALRARNTKKDGPLTGAELAKGFDEILQPPGAPSEVLAIDGAKAVAGAVAGIQSGLPVHFIGMTGPWLFPPVGGKRTRRGTMGVSYFCFKKGATGFAYYLDAAGLTTNVCEQ